MSTKLASKTWPPRPKEQISIEYTGRPQQKKVLHTEYAFTWLKSYMDRSFMLKQGVSNAGLSKSSFYNKFLVAKYRDFR